MKFTRVFGSVLDKTFTATPRRISPKIQALCAQIVSGEPEFVPIICAPHCKPGDCYFNVQAQIEKFGGEIIFGWGIWEWRDVFIEAEHHAIWSSDGKRQDITPSGLNAKQVLFLADPSTPYDFETKKRHASYRVATRDSEYIKSWLHLAEERQKFEMSLPVGEEYHCSEEEAQWIRQVEGYSLHAKAAILIELANRTQDRSPCICGGIRQFRKCCMPYFA